MSQEAPVLYRVGTLLGRHVAPPKFLLFGAAFVIVSLIAEAWLGDMRFSMLLGFDVASLVFLATVFPLLDHDTRTMREATKTNDANRSALLAMTTLISTVILFAIGTLITRKETLQWQGVSLVVSTLVLTWLFANTVFALHYAHLFYLQDDEGDQRGLEIPHTEAPNYWDFLYFSFTLGMTFQTSDVAITGRHMRKVALGQSVMAFIFNMGVLAFTVNALGGL
ncbi:MAG TPA: DUF1345 domain-containing protein [Rhodocyclaceae bacterium]|nr:DUF1345 domain-containing protein [Rhodocyclaceae bacterium]